MNSNNMIFGNVAYNISPKCLMFQNILMPIESKVYAYIVDMVRYNSAEKKVKEPYYIGRQNEIARYLGYRRESVCRAVKSLIGLGLIKATRLYEGSPLKYTVCDIKQSKLWKSIKPSRRYPLNDNHNDIEANHENTNDKALKIELNSEQKMLKNYVNNKLTNNKILILWSIAQDNPNIDNDNIFNVITNIYDNIQYHNYKVINLHGYLKKALQNYTPQDTNSNNANMMGKADGNILNLEVLKKHKNVHMSIDTTRYNNINNTHHECVHHDYVSQDIKRIPHIIGNPDKSNIKNTDNTNNIINSIYGKLIYDFPSSMHLYKSQVEHICEIVNNKIDSKDNLFHAVVHDIFAKVYIYILRNGEKSISNVYMYMLKMAHSYGDTNNNNNNNNNK